MADHRAVAKRLLAENMNAHPGETLLVVTDTDTNHIGRALFDAGVELGLESGLFEIPPMERNGMEPPGSVARAMESADIVVCPTSASLTHTRAREAATEAGARVATMPGITDQMFGEGAITADYEEVERLTAALTEKLTAADEARIEADGASATMSLSGRDGIPSDGIIAEPGDSGNLPSGESYIAPVEGTATGTLVFDGGLAGVGVLDEPLTVELDEGRITAVEGAAADEFLDATSGDDCARRVCELGLGTNPAASIIGTVLEDEKVYGTCHVAFGDNLGFGGTIDCDSHLDGVILEPTVSLDGEVVVADGEVLV
ncbi:aminopeptidase [Haloferax sp. Atlit-10N]|uniref:Leucyl aminopeptidase n=1 Tax=Haloferax prahovense (strain DSM 18310 / JCM 13924 / TL6) TaxID=1227461 RepID=M0FZF0_HALPT|nr:MULTISPECIES: aminopeptidase [Haloferax]ELZ65350.1 leucyl aminopeptidase [Haloferax prahovense DSM 18310]RDZ45197.1 aminopeptidase [Haloferax sp. Atlit-16N]RDZ48561.1 aminopeptidase [Haloferax sp. Atlit-19N]RDZ59026.1 aminopeptidase [Haloferax sp. Atlit-10N]